MEAVLVLKMTFVNVYTTPKLAEVNPSIKALYSVVGTAELSNTSIVLAESIMYCFPSLVPVVMLVGMHKYERAKSPPVEVPFSIFPAIL
ncbi:hypothetical protein SDC9_183724 [bioreactor metagenome]|uniref:Uncharacterized protein n=1 Tax=bioreactor metagenome TaxID=1076179 RepID=A0A645HCH1_9ZZZZ